MTAETFTYPDTRKWEKRSQTWGTVYLCEHCGRYTQADWLGADYGMSHFFCDNCLTIMELMQGEIE